ncbi:MAG: asparaginase domain-containing protein [Desulfobacteraceae bacterium]|nr:asparaginase domain-containing protein [Desulfobacteraceae bacterium]
MEIQIITTGGTIDKLYFDAKSEFQVGDPQVVDVLREANVTVPYSVRQLMRKDSLELTEADRRLIRDTIAAAPQRHFVVTHGTDTMLDTARVLQTLGDKVIVLTGAMQPARFRFTDAVFNIGCAVMAVQLLPAGVYVAMNGRIFDPRRTVKNREQNRFEAHA